MGQQQLLLLVLGIVIVGIAIVVGIDTYSENSVKNNYDALLQDVLRIATDAQNWKTKPDLFGGQDDSRKHDKDDFTDARFSAWGYSRDLIGSGTLGDGTCYANLNGVYDIAVAGAEGIRITGASAQHINQTQVFLSGVLEPDITLGSSSSGPTTGDLCIGGADVIDGAPCTVGVVTACDVS